MFNMFHVNVGLDKDSCLEGEHSVEDLERRGVEERRRRREPFALH